LGRAVLARLALLWPRDGGKLELSGVLGGWSSFSRNSLFSASSAAIRARSALIRASSSAALSVVRSGG
jgi:hypothetical protein